MIGPTEKELKKFRFWGMFLLIFGVLTRYMIPDSNGLDNMSSYFYSYISIFLGLLYLIFYIIYL